MITRVGISPIGMQHKHNAENNTGLPMQKAQFSPSFGAITISNTTAKRLYPLKKFLKTLSPDFKIDFCMEKPPQSLIDSVTLATGKTTKSILDTVLDAKTTEPLEIVLTSKHLSPLYGEERGPIINGIDQFSEGFKKEALIAQVLKTHNADLDIVIDHPALMDSLLGILN